MSLALLEPREPACEAPALYWVIGGCYGDDTRSWRRWSEVVGPFGRRDSAEAERRKLQAIFRTDGRVHFEVVTRPTA